jgi:hypothetical protein
MTLVSSEHNRRKTRDDARQDLLVIVKGWLQVRAVGEKGSKVVFSRRSVAADLCDSRHRVLSNLCESRHRVLSK